ncbi:TIGR01777 family oxidoreductase [Marinomonas transparens]|uniref:TIGR01777 family oxidoreductase n=1 Tax=Marinomonas transparens TaxID=2795388 RepID=A0A934JLW8_9GAMM|nr:TIGR01777 family oxidoreductase [Marinomonas transparens]MBJ7538216.1 TIGR01777 family oxidoreductase [Marinomonas transparens]
MKILISGATGFIGQSLLPELLKSGHQITALVRQKDNRLDDSINQITLESLDSLDSQMDAFINLAGESIASKPWTKKRKKTLYDSRITLTNTVRKKLKQAPKLVISMSAVGFYGVSIDDVFTENATPSGGFAHDLCRDWENAAQTFTEGASRVVIFRLGVVLGAGGALEKMRLPFLCGLGGPIASGKQWFPWIHQRDVIKGVIAAINDDRYIGTYNFVSPQAIQQKDFAKQYARALKRPAFMPMPKWVLDLALGEMASLLTHGPKIIPQRLEQQGFQFEFANLDKALEDIEQKHQIY